MVSKIHDTLYGVIKDHEDHFEKVVLKAIESELVKLGDRIYQLDWASIAVKSEATKAA